MIKHTWWLFIVWLLVIVAVSVYFIQRRLVEFDPNHQLEGVPVSSYTKLAFEVFEKGETSASSSNVLYHISTQNCHCNSLINEHVSTLNNQAESYGYKVKNVVLTPEELALHAEIPSTPAVMLIGNNNEFVYFGPYAQGFGCSETAGMIELSLNNYQKGFNSAVIFADASGCYCENANSNSPSLR